MPTRRSAALAAVSITLVAGVCAPSSDAATMQSTTPRSTNAPSHAKSTLSRTTKTTAPRTTKTTAPRTTKTTPPRTTKTTAPRTTKAPASAPRTTDASYTNWAGYQVRTANPTSARASWRVPQATWHGRDGYSNQWVGIGGGNAAEGQLIQAGTESDNVCITAKQGRCISSRPVYYLWLETYPQQSQERITNLAISPGDLVDVEVGYRTASGAATFTLCNRTRYACVTATRKTAPPRSVAEFIVERPSDATGRPFALAKFGTAAFSSMTVKNGSQTVRPGALPATRITMFNGRPLATTSALTRNGTAFSTTYQRSL